MTQAVPLTPHTHARDLVLRHGQNPASYLALESDKTLYFGKHTGGVIAYATVGKTIIVCGDPICDAADFPALLAEFKDFCNRRPCVFIGTTGAFLSQYGALGYHHVKCGEEARFLLHDYNLAGGAHARIRADINHASKAGLSTHEYKPLVSRDPAIEQAMADISKSWLAGKHGENLGFTIGSVGLESPMDRRYFYAKDRAGNIVAFHVFIPFGGPGERGAPTGYLADLTHRSQGAPGGVTEKINYDAFMTFRDEGCTWGSLGLAPLANLLAGVPFPDTDTKLLHFFYEHFNRFYEFKALHLAKTRYSPTLWEPGYFVYSTKHMTPQMVYGIIRVQSPGGVGAYLKELFHKN